MIILVIVTSVKIRSCKTNIGTCINGITQSEQYLVLVYDCNLCYLFIFVIVISCLVNLYIQCSFSHIISFFPRRFPTEK